MIDRDNPPIDRSHADMEQKKDFDSLKSQLDACMEKEEIDLAKTMLGEHTAADLPAGQGQFVDEVQHDLDSIMQATPIKSTSTKTLTLADADMLIGEVMSFSPSVEHNTMSDHSEIASGEHIVDKKAVNKGIADKEVELEAVDSPVSYSNVVFTLLFGVGGSVAALLWFVGPTDSVRSLQGIVLTTLGIADKKQALDPLQPVEVDMGDMPVLKEKKQALDSAEVMVAMQPLPRSKSAVASPELVLPVEPKAAAVMLKKLTVAVKIGNIRSAPSTSAKVVFKLRKGAEVKQLQRVGDWYQLRLENGSIAWAHDSIF